MIRIIEESEVEDMVFKDNYILIMCKKLSSKVIQELGKKCRKVGIYYRNGFVLDTINGIISKVSKTENLSYELKLYIFQENLLKGSIDYEVFYDFIKMRKFFNDYFKISLYWDKTSDKCIFEKTTLLDKLGGCGLDKALKPIRQININSKIFAKIKLLPDLQETLDTFVDETKISQYYKD